MTQPTRAQSMLEQYRADQHKARWQAIRWITGLVLVVGGLLLLIRYAWADVQNVDAYLTGRAIQANVRCRSLRLQFDRATARIDGIKSAAQSGAAGCVNHEGGTSIINSYLGKCDTCGGPTPAASNSDISNPQNALRPGNVTGHTPSGGVCPGPAALTVDPDACEWFTSAQLWSVENYCDVDSDVLTRRDFLTDYAHTVYGIELEAAEQAADHIIWFAQTTGADLWFTAGTVAAESGFNTNAKNRSSGCTGLFQCHPVHKKRMARLGYDFSLEGDRVEFCALHLYAERGWQPWVSSARKARKIARKLEARWNESDHE